MTKAAQIAIVVMIAAMLVLLTACARGPVVNKRAPGELGDKTYEILIKDTWIQVPEQVWDDCSLDEPYPECSTAARD